MSRVSSGAPFSENSFQSFVPTGNTQWSMSEVSICVPGGRRTQRRFVAPSAHRMFVGSKATASGVMLLAARSTNRPVSERCSYVGGA